VRILRRRSLIAFFTFVVVVTTTLIATSFMKPVYEATARVLLDGPNITATPNNILDLIAGSGASPLEAEIEKIKARSFLETVIKEEHLVQETPETLKSRLVVTITGGGQILDIAYRGSTAKEAKAIADRIATRYIALVRQEYLDKADLSEQRLKEARDEALDEKNRAEATLNTFLSRVGMSDPEILYRDRAQTTVSVRNDLEGNQRNLTLLQKNLLDYQAQLKRIPPEVMENYTLVKNPVIDTYKQQVVELQQQRQKLLFDYAPDSDEVKAVDTEIQSRQAAISDAEKNKFDAGSRGIARNPDYSKVQSSIFDTLMSIMATEHNIASLRKRYADLQKQQKVLTPQQNEYEGLKRKRDAANEAYEKARQGLINMNMTRVMSAPNLRILEDAKLPEQPLSPKPLLNLAMAIALGLFLGTGMALLAEYMTSGTMVEDSLSDFPVVGGVPLLGAVSVALPRPVANNSDGLPALIRSTANMTDTLREIGFSLTHRHAKEPVPVVLFTGTRSDDSTAAIAAQLAATLVRDGIRVTLVDADRANPRLNRIFGAPDAPGVADVLAGRHKAKDILYVGANGNLRFLSAGAPTDLTPMSDMGLRTLFRELAVDRDTDIVLVSGPSVWQAPVIAPLEKAATGMVLIAPDAARGITPAESVARARRLLSNGYKPRIIGVVVGLDEAEEGTVIPSLTSRPEDNALSTTEENVG
jgi:uncharacterized protein involved in exopolysaccharide biosynthesis/Mrp family chromosome partitioning ATPase